MHFRGVGNEFLKKVFQNYMCEEQKQFQISFAKELKKFLLFNAAQQARKFKKVQAKKIVKSNKSKKFFVKLYFWQF